MVIFISGGSWGPGFTFDFWHPEKEKIQITENYVPIHKIMAN
jgi:hypothetical protein